MDEHEFRRILDLFPVVRPGDYCFQDESGRASSSHSAQDEVTKWMEGWTEMDKMDELKENKSQDAFWSKLRAAAERKHIGGSPIHASQRGGRKLDAKLVARQLGPVPIFLSMVGPANAEMFCTAFKTVHEKLVYKELSLEAAQRFISTVKTDLIRTDS